MWFRREVEAPFFAYYLKDRGSLPLPEALVFEGGANRWRSYDAWPPRDAVARNLYLREGGRLGFDAPSVTGDAYDQYVSDPAYPVPYRPRPVQITYSPGSRWRVWQVLDQRFVEGRPDVLVWATEPLAEDIRIPPQAYRVQRGHRIMVQVQSTWFPLYDRNPQTWVPNIFQASDRDYRAQTHRIWRTARYPSHVVLPVIPE